MNRIHAKFAAAVFCILAMGTGSSCLVADPGHCIDQDPFCNPVLTLLLVTPAVQASNSTAVTSDFNGDGYSDLAVGANQNDDGTNTGEGSPPGLFGAG